MAYSAFIQAGGLSSRMRTDKAWLPFGLYYSIELVIRALEPVADEIAIVANNPEYQRLGLPVYPDVVKSYGPLGGIHSALLNARNDSVFIVACDLPFVSADLFRQLITFRQGYQIIVPTGEDGQTQQLCAIYTRNCLQQMVPLINEDVRTPRALFDRCSTRYVSWSDLSYLPNAQHFFDNLNTPEDYHRALMVYQSNPGAQ